ncbi:MAG: hypothetical protein U0U46_16215 [Saprospiraceae bacterium]
MSNTADARQVSRRKNFILRVHAVQNAYRQNKRPGVPDAWIFRNHIGPAFGIAERTFREYLTVNVRRELRQIGFDPDTVLA